MLAIGTLIAAEGARGETYADVTEATILALGLYWLAHAYTSHFGTRLERTEQSGIQWVIPALLHEAAILKGAALPIVAHCCSPGCFGPRSRQALLPDFGQLVWRFRAGTCCWVATSSCGAEIAIEVALGVVLGAGVLGIRVLLH